MNFVSGYFSDVRASRTRVVFRFLLAALLSIYVVGCSEQVRLPSPEGLAEFQNAGPAHPTVDMDRMARAKIGGGPYRVAPGDVLELTMPAILQIATAEAPGTTEEFTPYVCRVSESGVITLTIVGRIEVAGKTLSQIESAVIDAYYPKYAVTPPSVFARILEYKTAKVSITGAVENPGVYELRSDQMSLVALLMEAGGIVDEGAALIQISHPYGVNAKLSRSDSKQNSISNEALENELLELLEAVKSLKVEKTAKLGRREKVEPIVLPVRGLNIPFADVALQDGDSVIVERLREQLITVVGLVNRPGTFPYPPDVEYNLMQALGFAGGLLLSAEPRYATIYRLRADGTTVSAAFNIVNVAKNADPTDAISVPLKPYDVIAVEHTPRTRAKVFWDRVFRMYITTYIRMEDVLGYED